MAGVLGANFILLMGFFVGVSSAFLFFPLGDSGCILTTLFSNKSGVFLAFFAVDDVGVLVFFIFFADTGVLLAFLTDPGVLLIFFATELGVLTFFVDDGVFGDFTFSVGVLDLGVTNMRGDLFGVMGDAFPEDFGVFGVA